EEEVIHRSQLTQQKLDQDRVEEDLHHLQESVASLTHKLKGQLGDLLKQTTSLQEQSFIQNESFTLSTSKKFRQGEMSRYINVSNTEGEEKNIQQKSTDRDVKLLIKEVAKREKEIQELKSKVQSRRPLSAPFKR